MDRISDGAVDVGGDIGYDTARRSLNDVGAAPVEHKVPFAHGVQRIPEQAVAAIARQEAVSLKLIQCLHHRTAARATQVADEIFQPLLSSVRCQLFRSRPGLLLSQQIADVLHPLNDFVWCDRIVHREASP